MNRTQRLRGHYRRAAWLGLGLSIALHAGILAIVRFNVPAVPSQRNGVTEVASVDEPEARQLPDAIEVVTIRSATAQPDRAGSGSAASSSAPATASAPAPAPAAGEPMLPASVEPGSSFDRFAILDPLDNATAQPVAFTSLPVAETTPHENPTDEVPVYVPGSVGKAKRQWANEGNGEDDRGVGLGWGVVVGDDHCPMPSGGRGPWRGPLRGPKRSHAEI